MKVRSGYWGTEEPQQRPLEATTFCLGMARQATCCMNLENLSWREEAFLLVVLFVSSEKIADDVIRCEDWEFISRR